MLSLTTWEGGLAALGVLFCGVGFVAAFTRRTQLSLGATAWGSTLFGASMFMIRLDLFHVAWGTVLFVFAVALVVVASIHERKTYGQRAEREGQADGLVHEGPGHQP